jgi:hypothetical protein
LRIAVVKNFIPFQKDCIDELARKLVNKISQFGHQTEIIHIPFDWTDSKALIDHVKSIRLLHLQCFFDQIIALEIPACFVDHSSKTWWLMNTSSFFQELEKKNLKPHMIDKVIHFGARSIADVSAIYTPSIKDREFIQRHWKKDCEILSHPLSEHKCWDKVIEKLIF